MPLLIYQVILFFGIFTLYSRGGEEEDHGVLYPSACEVCKYLAVELQARLEETGKSHEVIETGYNTMSSGGKKKKYANSELRLLESTEGICERILEYNIHKERKDSTRFAKGMSQTFETLHGLVNKGVKVDLGIPYDLWDKPSAEVVAMKTQCESLLEKHEEDIENWFFNHQNIPLPEYLCKRRALKGDDGCLEETLPGPSKEAKPVSKVPKTKKTPKDDL